MIRTTTTLLFLLAISCERTPPVESFQLLIGVRDLSGSPLANTSVTLENKAAGKTDANGNLRTTLHGKEGRRVSVHAQCGAGFRTGEKSSAHVTLRLLHAVGKKSDTPLPLTVDLTCIAVTQQFVLVVKTNQKEKLPIVVDGRAIGQTDADGVAQTVLSGPIGEEIEVVLGTDAYPALSPQSPSRRLVIPDTPQILIFEQDFRSAKPKKRKHRGRVGPKRI